MTTRQWLIAGLLIGLIAPIESALASSSFMILPEIAPVTPMRRPKPKVAVDQQTEGTITAPRCTDCVPAPTRANREVVRVAGQSEVIRSSRISFRTRGKAWAASCKSQFINTDGTLGGIGRKLANLMSSGAYKKQFAGSKRSLTEVCPNYANLNEPTRKMAWIWFWMVLANEESSCTVKKAHATHLPNGRRLNPKPGYGLYAAELYPQHRNWRGKMCQGNIRNENVQLKCAVHTMAATQLKKGRGVLWNGSYWGPVRRYSRQIIPNMRGFKACF